MRDNKDNKEPQKTKRLREILEVLRRRDILHGVSPQKLKMILEDLGPTYVKLGQIMSMRSDMLPQEYCDELTKLRMDVRPMEFPLVIEILEREYGCSYKKIFSEIEPQALGSASIAQVHAARLLDGRKVVLKVQRPDIKKKMAQDIKLMKRAAGILRVLGGTGDLIDFNAVIDEMWIVSQQEMDFLLEADHCVEFSKINAEIAYIRCPSIERGLTTEKILVMEYISGIRIDELAALDEQGYDRNEICHKLSENYIKQILEDGFFHADPHPGNIWVSGGKIVWLDLGMVGKLSNRDRELFKKAVTAAVTNDIAAVKDVLLTLGTPRGPVRHTQLYTDIDTMMSKYMSMGLGNINVGVLMREMMELVKQHNIAMPTNITMLWRGLITFEGTLSKCAPELSLMEVLSAHVASSMIHELDMKGEMKSLGKELYNMTRKAIELPVTAADFLKMLQRGQAKINLELIGSQEPLQQIGHMVNRLIVCIIIAAMLVGSSLICTTQMKPDFFGIPALGALGFFLAFVLGLVLVIDIYNKRKH